MSVLEALAWALLPALPLTPTSSAAVIEPARLLLVLALHRRRPLLEPLLVALLEAALLEAALLLAVAIAVAVVRRRGAAVVGVIAMVGELVE